MFGRKSTLAWMAVLSGIVLLSLPPPTVQADFQVELFDNGVGIGSISGIQTPAPTPGAGNTYSGSTADFQYAVVVSSNTPGSNGQGTLTNIGLALSGGGLNGGTLTVVVSATGYTTPGAGPMTLSSSASASAVGSSTGGSMSFQSYQSNNNTLFATGVGSVTTGPQTGTFVSGSLSNSSNLGTVTTVFTGADPYSLTSVLNITINANGTDISVSGQTAVSTPAPGGVVLAASAFPMLIGGWFLRRRKQLQIA